MSTIIQLLLFLILAVSDAFACSCAEKTPVDTAVKESTAIFVGRVTSIGSNPLKKRKSEVKMQVVRYLKGLDELPTDQVIFYTATNEAECGYKFERNGEYLVYLKGTPAAYRTDLCSRTQAHDLVREEVVEIKDILKAKEGPSGS